MKCIKHKRRHAVAVCSFCGAGLCHDCAGKTTDGRWVCSSICRRISGTITHGFEDLHNELHMLSRVQAVASVVAGMLFFLAGPIVIPSGFLFLGVYLMVAGVICAGAGLAWHRKEVALRKQ